MSLDIQSGLSAIFIGIALYAINMMFKGYIGLKSVKGLLELLPGAFIFLGVLILIVSIVVNFIQGW